MKIIRPTQITDTMLLASNIAEDDYPQYNPASSYTTGQYCIVTEDHAVYESLKNDNSGNPPATSPQWWLHRGSTNRWAMFDDKIGTQSKQADLLTATISIPTRCTALALLNLDAVSASITMTDAVDGVVYSHNASLISTGGITDWYAYFFEEIKRERNLILTDLPPYANASIAVTLEATGGIAACGVLLAGQAREIGGTQYGVQVGIQDYSVKQRDAWGNSHIVTRDYSSTGRFQVELANSVVDEVHHLLAELRSVPTLYIGADNYHSTALYGYFNDFNISISYFNVSICSIDIESLV